jgi:zinc transport system substrate-binding protein
MHKKNYKHIAFFCKVSLSILFLVTLLGCSEKSAKKTDHEKTKLTIYTTIAPHYFACRQILGGQDTIINICPRDKDAADYMPDHDVLTQMIQSDLIITNGASFEQWLPYITLPDSKVLDASLSFKNDWLSYQEEKLHTHGTASPHSHKGINGHTWMAPYYYQKQCERIYNKLRDLLSEEEQKERKLHENYQKLQEQISALSDEMGYALSSLKDKTIAATHPSYDYIGKQYGFSVFNITLDPDANSIDENTNKEIDRLDKMKQKSGIKYLFWESEPSKIIAEKVESLGVKNVIFPPLENIGDIDYIAGMKANIGHIKEALNN